VARGEEMSGKEPDWTVCPFTGKRRFTTKEDGRRMLLSARRNPNHRKRGRLAQRVVLCQGCMGYHLTSKTRKT
jgi:hypothetical protein